MGQGKSETKKENTPHSTTISNVSRQRAKMHIFAEGSEGVKVGRGSKMPKKKNGKPTAEHNLGE